MQIENSNVQVTSKNMPIGNMVLSDAVFRPMLFSTPMVQALLNGTKTQTRRTQGLEDLNESNELYDWQFVTIYSDDDEKSVVGFKARNGFSDTWKQVYKKINIGDIIWVRETFGVEHSTNMLNVKMPIYKTDSNAYLIDKWKPSLFMTKDACRLWLKVTNVRVEKLQDISEEDAKDEGISWNKGIIQSGYGYDGSVTHISARTCYKELWNKINGKDSWDANPFVWVYDFEVIREAPYGFR